MANYPKRPVFVPSDALRKIEREIEEVRIEVMSISNIVNMDPKVRAILARKRAEETLERIKPIVRQAENQKLLRDRRKRIHEHAKRLVIKPQPASAAQRRLERLKRIKSLEREIAAERLDLMIRRSAANKRGKG